MHHPPDRGWCIVSFLEQANLVLHARVADARNAQTGVEGVRQAAGELGRLDALINNASLFFPTPLRSADEEQWRRMMDTNL
ncbi:MAG: SDR family NAD(P)-dependent oxidoreductase, partial [bacterium]